MGRTSLLKCYLGESFDSFEDRTSCVNEKNKEAEIDRVKVRIQFWGLP